MIFKYCNKEFVLFSGSYHIWELKNFKTASFRPKRKWPSFDRKKIKKKRPKKEKLRTRAVFPPLAFLCMHNSMTFLGNQHTHTHTCLPANSATKEPLLLSLLYYSLLHQPSSISFLVAFIFIARRPLLKDSRHKCVCKKKVFFLPFQFR
jgi:hypothetical protein